jgi:hypothetical protein
MISEIETNNNNNMQLDVENNSYEIVSFTRLGTSGEIQIVVNRCEEISEGTILVFKDKDGEEILGLVKEVMRSDEDLYLYVEPNPGNEVKVKSINSIQVWGKI